MNIFFQHIWNGLGKKKIGTQCLKNNLLFFMYRKYRKQSRKVIVQETLYTALRRNFILYRTQEYRLTHKPTETRSNPQSTWNHIISPVTSEGLWEIRTVNASVKLFGLWTWSSGILRQEEKPLKPAGFTGFWALVSWFESHWTRLNQIRPV